MSEQSFTFVDNRTGKSVVLPILKGTQGPEAVDVRTFFSKTGLFLFDPGYASIASCESSITYIDGVEGLMQYRGYPIEQLSKHSTFLEVAYLLLHGELPNENQYSTFVKQVKGHVMVQDRIRHFIEGFRPDAHPMAVMVGVVGALSSFYHDSLDVYNPEHRLLASIRLIAKMPTIAAWAYKYTIGHPFIYPRRELGFAENLLYMMFATPCDDYKVNPVVARALDKILVLHADHEQNMSTCTVRIAGSSHSNPFACIASGIAALWGPDHGGANEAALKMLITIGHKDRIPEFLAKAKDKKDPFRLMGFGHRVYKNFDPRALIIKQACHEVLSELGLKEQPLFALALELEKIALEDQYFIERSLYPNVDFYSGILLHAMGIPVNMFTVVFAIARVVGWVAQWKEMIESPNWRLSRPRQVYMGEPKRPYVPIAQRNQLKDGNTPYPPSPLLSQAKPPSLW